MQPETLKPPPIDPDQLPLARSTDLVLAIATPIEHVQTAQINAEEWRGCLTTEQYLARETALHSTDLTCNGGITCWILTSASISINPDGTRPIFASCESIRYQGYIGRNGSLQSVNTHGIGTVYTRAEYRGKGYASRMMADLGSRLETWQQAPNVKNAFSILFSDIGPVYYSKLGWAAYPSKHVLLAPLDQKSYERDRIGLPEVEGLKASDLSSIPTTHYLEHELRTKSSAFPNTYYLAIRPSVEHFTWHHAREEFVCRSLGTQVPTVKGVIHETTGLALIWNRVFAVDRKDWQLQILLTIIPPGAEGLAEAKEVLSALLLSAQWEAYKWGMLAGVIVWDPPDLLISAASSLGRGYVDLVERDQESICSLRWSGQQNDKLVWIAKQKYTWC